MPFGVGPRTLVAFGHDVVVAALAWCLAFWLRLNLEVPEPYFSAMLESLAWVVPLQAVVFWTFGLYRGIWRYASVSDLLRIAVAVSAAGALVAVGLALQPQPTGVPRSVLLIDPLLLAVMMGASRLLYRAWRERRGQLPLGESRGVFVLGAGDAGARLVGELAAAPQWRVAGLFDDNGGKHGRSIHGVKVLGGLDRIARARESLPWVTHAVIAMPGSGHAARRRAAERAADAGLRVLTVPSFDDLASGRVTVSQLRDVELDDLLGRDPVVLDDAGLNGWIRGRTVLVTGAGGSIGSELCRQVARFAPARLVMLDASEYALYTIEQEFAREHPQVAITAIAADVRSAPRLAQVFAKWQPQVVLHAAAYKHVPLMETDNCAEAVLNNVAGTLATARAAIASGADKFVLVSTDKAVNPTNVMGATKRLAEMACERLQEPARTTRFVMVRFGNVLGSTGSVIPRFREQIAAGGPVTVTDPNITRYFMSIPEAAQLVLQAGLMGRGGEIFVLDMGEPVRIADLAREMIRLSGFGTEEIRIVYTGLRPGEKLYEEPLADDEQTLGTPHPKLRIAKARASGDDVLSALDRWLATLANDPPEDDAIKRELARFVPEYQPQGLDEAASPPGSAHRRAVDAPGTGSSTQAADRVEPAPQSGASPSAQPDRP